MSEETRPARRPGRRGPEVRCRTGAGRAPSRPAAASPNATPHDPLTGDAFTNDPFTSDALTSDPLAGDAFTNGAAAGEPVPGDAVPQGAVFLDETGAWTPGPVPGLAVDVAERRPGAAVIAVTGEIDLHTADALRARLVREHAAGARRLVLDFSGVPFCDAAGLGALVGAHNEISASGGEIALAGVRPAQLRLLRITGLHRLFVLSADVVGALAGQGAPTGSR
jgi:anti-anti-sigma factor